MAKISLLLVIIGLCLLQAQANRSTCDRIIRICEANQLRVGHTDYVTNYLNNDCRRRNPRWRDITRCEMGRASCELSLVSCGEFSCENIARVLGR